MTRPPSVDDLRPLIPLLPGLARAARLSVADGEVTLTGHRVVRTWRAGSDVDAYAWHSDPAEEWELLLMKGGTPVAVLAERTWGAGRLRRTPTRDGSDLAARLAALGIPDTTAPAGGPGTAERDEAILLGSTGLARPLLFAAAMLSPVLVVLTAGATELAAEAGSRGAVTAGQGATSVFIALGLYPYLVALRGLLGSVRRPTRGELLLRPDPAEPTRRTFLRRAAILVAVDQVVVRDSNGCELHLPLVGNGRVSGIVVVPADATATVILVDEFGAGVASLPGHSWFGSESAGLAAAERLARELGLTLRVDPTGRSVGGPTPEAIINQGARRHPTVVTGHLLPLVSALAAQGPATRDGDLGWIALTAAGVAAVTAVLAMLLDAVSVSWGDRMVSPDR